MGPARYDSSAIEEIVKTTMDDDNVAPIGKKGCLGDNVGNQEPQNPGGCPWHAGGGEDMLAEILVNVGRIGIGNEPIKEIDINPVIISGFRSVAVDALIIRKKRPIPFPVNVDPSLFKNPSSSKRLGSQFGNFP